MKRPGPRPCAACGQTFTPIRIDQTELCSRYCQELAQGRRKYGPHGFVITCVICGKRRAVVHPSKKACHACTPEYRRRDREARKDPKARREYDQRRYVTHGDYYREKGRQYSARMSREAKRNRYMRLAIECALAAWRVDQWWLALPPGPPVPKPAPPRRLPVSDIGARPTTRRFAAGFCAACGEAFVSATPGRGDRFCSPACERRHNRRRRRGPATDPAVRAAVFAYDDFRCQLCGGPTRPDLAVPALLAPVIDHIQPRSVGGPDASENFRTAHFWCNSLRQALDDEEFEHRYPRPRGLVV